MNTTLGNDGAVALFSVMAARVYNDRRDTLVMGMAELIADCPIATEGNERDNERAKLLDTPLLL